MKKSKLLFLLILLFICPSSIVTILFFNRHPDIYFPNGNRYDFGSIDEGKSTEHTFEFENRGKKDLIIEKVITSCGCTAAKVACSPKPVP